jgi:hypothetical protein
MRTEYEKFRESAKARTNRGKITFRAVANILENVHLEETVRGFRLECDEPEERGGTNLAPAPLPYSILQTQESGVELKDLIARQREAAALRIRPDLAGVPCIVRRHARQPHGEDRYGIVLRPFKTRLRSMFEGVHR